MIDISGWGEFRIGDLFHVLKGKRLTKMQMRDGEIPFIGSSAVNNGVTASIANDEHIVQPPAMTVCYNGSVGSAFFQDKPFAASDDVNVLTLKDRLLTRETALFLAPIFRIYGRKYAYADKWRKEIMEQDMIKLPVTLLGEPDWDYMESYMKQIMDRAESDLELLQNAHGTKHPVGVIQWGEFPIINLFDLSLPKGDLQVKKVEDGTVPLITPSKYNNGQLKRISEHSPSSLYQKGTITVDMFGNAYYQEEDFFVTAHGHVNVLLPKKTVNVYCGSFLASAIRAMFWDKYGFDEMCTQKVLKKETIRLPIVSEGEPDWEYMDAYMRQAMDNAQRTVSTLACGV